MLGVKSSGESIEINPSAKLRVIRTKKSIGRSIFGSPKVVSVIGNHETIIGKIQQWIEVKVRAEVRIA